MQYLGISYSLRHIPELDPAFIPFGVWAKAYREKAAHPIAIAVEQNSGQICVQRLNIHNTPAMAQADYRYVERTVKFLLWAVGGCRVYVCGCSVIARKLREAYARTGSRAFDFHFFRQLYEADLEILDVPLSRCPAPAESLRTLGGQLNGCRIGFDAGGSDRKVCAVMDGRCIYSEEVIWFPKEHSDPDYQYRQILTAFRTAAAKLPRVDAIGVSSAGVFVGNAPMISSIFYRVPRERWEEVKTCYDRAAAQLGAPVTVANDGDVSALAGAMELGTGGVLGLAMGTSEAAGYVDTAGKLRSWISELAFAPVDLNGDAALDEWSADCGVGCKYFSQDAVLRLAPRAGISPDSTLPLAEQLKQVQALMECGDCRAEAIFRTIGVYLAHTLVLYAQVYDIRHLMLMGRVMSGAGGSCIADTCRLVLTEEYPELAAQCRIHLPDEASRRVGQAMAAASLPEVGIRRQQTEL